MTIQLPADLEDQVSAVAAVRPELRQLIACILYQRGIFSLGRAVEWSDLSIEALKAALAARGISRQAPESVDETESMARKAMARAGRAPA